MAIKRPIHEFCPACGDRTATLERDVHGQGMIREHDCSCPKPPGPPNSPRPPWSFRDAYLIRQDGTEVYEMPTPHRLDTDTQIFFYENEFYFLSNFSAFAMQWRGHRFDTSEAVYHWCKFPGHADIQEEIRKAMSAHDTQKISHRNKDKVRKDWDIVKLHVMQEILEDKMAQHPYIMKKLRDSGARELIEDSWRDGFWGWGPDKNGRNQLGKLWMKVRAKLPCESPKA